MRKFSLHSNNKGELVAVEPPGLNGIQVREYISAEEEHDKTVLNSLNKEIKDLKFQNLKLLAAVKDPDNHPHHPSRQDPTCTACMAISEWEKDNAIN